MFPQIGKVAIITGCDTELGQRMAFGLAEAGRYIAGISFVKTGSTIYQITVLGRRFHSLTTDLRASDEIPGLLDRAVSGCGHIDILVNNAGLFSRRPIAVMPVRQSADHLYGLPPTETFLL
ncbi:SDR family NAD(P)-dependent oxidoreductase [Pantoea agglomerans]|uniref:SDR family NAD(P)-dependent oxidoreductase n=1 Tax=Enterobacter agglomerans TaxID=549 RepID=UPI003AAC5435